MCRAQIIPLAVYGTSVHYSEDTVLRLGDKASWFSLDINLSVLSLHDVGYPCPGRDRMITFTPVSSIQLRTICRHSAVSQSCLPISQTLLKEYTISSCTTWEAKLEANSKSCL
jgi:hypothetical protein